MVNLGLLTPKNQHEKVNLKNVQLMHILLGLIPKKVEENAMFVVRVGDVSGEMTMIASQDQTDSMKELMIFDLKGCTVRFRNGRMALIAEQICQSSGSKQVIGSKKIHEMRFEEKIVRI